MRRATAMMATLGLFPAATGQRVMVVGIDGSVLTVR